MFSTLTVFATSLFMFLRTINSSYLRNWDEAWYAATIKNMASGQYGILMPFWNGRYYFDHAPLYFWLTLPFFKIFGAGEWQTRIISVFAASLATVFLFLIGKKLANKTAAFLSVIIFLTFGQVAIRFSHGNLDALLVCFFLASFYFYLMSEEKKIFSVISGILLGLGFLIKSWGIGLFPAFLIFIYSLAKSKSLPKNLTLMVFFAFISSSWWYIAGILKFGQDFLSWYILNPSEGRLITPIENPSFYYFQALIRDIGFWFIPLLIGALTSFKKFDFKKSRFLITFFFISLIYILSLNFLSDKSDWYNIPSYPLIALIIGYILSTTFKKSAKLGLLLIATVTILQVWNINRIENIYPERSKAGADLGKQAKEIIPKGNTVILDDHDFTAFLFYSDQEAIYTLEDNKKSDFAEWWKISHKDLEKFIKTQENVWIISPNPNNLGLDVKTGKIKKIYNGYSFIKY